MSLTTKEATLFFNFIEKSSSVDGKITRADLEKAVSVDTDGDGKITDIVQSRILPSGAVTTWTEKEIVDNNVAKWISCSQEEWANDQAIDLQEFLVLINKPFMPQNP